MTLQDLLKSRTALVLLAGLVYLTWKAVAQHFGLDDSAGVFGTDALGLGTGGVALGWALGHCDGLDGPVVTVARKALDSGNVNLVLPWVRAEDEGEIRRRSSTRGRCACSEQRRANSLTRISSKRWCASIALGKARRLPA